MLVRVDNVIEKTTQWGYTNADGLLEIVEVEGKSTVQILCEHEGVSRVYVNDIPNLIKALQAAYNSIQEKV